MAVGPPGERAMSDMDDPIARLGEVPGWLRAEALAAVEPDSVPTPPLGEGEHRTLNLALQGGGSHGAFTWGVLDALLEDGRVEFDSISATSAGAMNAAVMAAGWAENGRAGAREKLAAFWEKVADVGRWSPIQRTLVDQFMSNWRVDTSPGFLAMDFMSRVLSPYQTNPANLNPLRDVLADLVDIDLVRHASGLKLFICCLLYTSPSPRDRTRSRMPSSA